jgi:hypothetical protein
MTSSSEELCTLVVETKQRSIYKIPDVYPSAIRKLDLEHVWDRGESTSTMTIVNESLALLNVPVRIVRSVWFEHKDGTLELLYKREVRGG